MDKSLSRANVHRGNLLLKNKSSRTNYLNSRLTASYVRGLLASDVLKLRHILH